MQTRPAVNLDELDRRIVTALQMDGRATWRRIAEALGEPERTVTRRGSRLLETGVVRVVGKHVRGNAVLVRIQCTPGMLRVSAQALATRPDSTFVYLLTGQAGCVAELFCAPEQLADLVASDLPATPGVSSVTTSAVLHYYKALHNWHPALLAPDEVERLGAEHVPNTPVSNDDSPLDAIDRTLLRALSQDGRTTYEELARAARISETTARRRVESLRREGYTFIRAVIDPAVMGLPVQAMLWLRTAPTAIPEIGESLAASPNVRYVCSLVGEHQLLVDVTLPSLNALHEFVTTRGWPEHVRGLESSLVVQPFKRGGVLYA